MGFGVYGLGFRVKSLGFSVYPGNPAGAGNGNPHGDTVDAGVLAAHVLVATVVVLGPISEPHDVPHVKVEPEVAEVAVVVVVRAAATAAYQVWGLGFRVQGLGFRVKGLGFRD